jgi:hypothetical protein
MSRIFRPLLKALLPLLITTLFLEGLLRAFYPAPVYSRLREDSARIFRPTDWIMSPLPNLDTQAPGDPGITYQVQTNADGLRNPGLGRQKGAGVFRILALGDSFTFGMSVDNPDSYPAQLQNCLGAEMAGGVEVLNAGFQGYSADAFYVFYRALGREYQPDAVILGLFAQNDLQDLLENTWELDSAGMPRRVESLIRYVDEREGLMRFREAPINYRYPLLKDSHLYQWAYYLSLDPEPNNYIGLPVERVLRAPYYQQTDWLPANFQAFEQTLFILQGFQAELAAEGIPFVVLLIPSGQQYTTTLDWYKRPLSERNPQAAFRAAFEESGIEYIDLLPVFDSYPLEETYFGQSGHWTPRGNQVAAGAICAELLAGDWLPG